MNKITTLSVLGALVLLFSALSALPSPVMATAGNSFEKGVTGYYDGEPSPPPPLGTTLPPGPLSSDPLAGQTTTDTGTQTTVPPPTPTAPAATPPLISTPEYPMGLDPALGVQFPGQLAAGGSSTAGTTPPQTEAPPYTPPPSDPADLGHHPPGPPGPHPPGPGPTPPYHYPYSYPYYYPYYYYYNYPYGYSTYPWGQYPYYWRWSTFVTPSYRVPTYVEPIVYSPVISAFTSNPNYVQPGQSTVLSWNISNSPSSITIYPSVGSVPASGVYTVTPGSTTTYTLTASNSGGSVTASTTVTVAPPITSYYAPTTVAPTAAPVAVLTTTDTGSLANPWLLPAVLIGLLALAAIVIVLLVTRKPSMAAAGTHAGYLATNSVTTPATDSAHTTPVASGVRARLMASGGGEVGLTGGFRSLGRNDFRSMLTAGKADMISRQHLQLDYQDGVYYVEDRGSTNGTRLNGELIRGKGKFVLKDGDSLELADALNLTFKS